MQVKVPSYKEYQQLQGNIERTPGARARVYYHGNIDRTQSSNTVQRLTQKWTETDDKIGLNSRASRGEFGCAK